MHDMLQETIFHSSGSPCEVFLSSHVEPRISLSAVLRRCLGRVAQPGASMDAARLQASGRDVSYTCMYFYDHDNMSLRALTGAESSAIG